MSRNNVVFKDLEKFQKQIQKLQEKQMQQFTEECIKELAARLLAKAVKRTPVGRSAYHMEDITDENGNKVTYKRDGKNHKKGETKQRMVKDHHGGTLRRAWTIGNVVKTGNNYCVEVINPTLYSEYVEYGHRGVYVPALGKVMHLNKRWTEGRFMLTISEQEIKDDAPKVIEEKLKKFLGECFND